MRRRNFQLARRPRSTTGRWLFRPSLEVSHSKSSLTGARGDDDRPYTDQLCRTDCACICSHNGCAQDNENRLRLVLRRPSARLLSSCEKLCMLPIHGQIPYLQCSRQQLNNADIRASMSVLWGIAGTDPGFGPVEIELVLDERPWIASDETD